jgi:hypothetical protein
MHSPLQRQKNADAYDELGRDRQRASRPNLPAITSSSFEQHGLGRVIAAWSDRGAPLPVAIVASVFDDLCAELELVPAQSDVALSTWQHPVALDQVVIDAGGIAHWAVQPADPIGAIARLLSLALGARGDDLVPAAIRPLILHGLSDDPLVRPASVESIRSSLRTSLGAPAQRSEVCLSLSVLGTPELASDELATEVVDPMMIPILSERPMEAPTVQETATPPAMVPRSIPPPSSTPRPVVRLQPEPRKPISLPAAPAARVGPMPQGTDDRSGGIVIPTDDHGHLWLAGVLFVVAIGIVGWLLGLFTV